MLKDKLEVTENGRVGRRTVLKGLLVGLGAGVLVQASGGVMAFAQEKTEETGKKRQKGADIKTEKGKESKGKGNEKKKTEEPKNQHKK